jgi:hypothetical protein
MSLTREQILEKNTPAKQEMEVPAWGGSVWLQTVPLGETLELLEQETDAHRGLMLLERAVVNEEGGHVFKPGDVEKLLFTPGLEDLLAKAIELNPMFQRTEEDEPGN